MELENIEKQFSLYVESTLKLTDLKPFLLSYIDLLLLFKDEVSEAEEDALLRRRAQLRGEIVEVGDFDEIRRVSRNSLDESMKSGSSSSRRAMINRLLFCAFLDTLEEDLFYLTEPMFEFAREMQVSSNRLAQILEDEFVGLKMARC
jgi:hypothetical protein